MYSFALFFKKLISFEFNGPNQHKNHSAGPGQILLPWWRSEAVPGPLIVSLGTLGYQDFVALSTSQEVQWQYYILNLRSLL